MDRKNFAKPAETYNIKKKRRTEYRTTIYRQVFEFVIVYQGDFFNICMLRKYTDYLYINVSYGIVKLSMALLIYLWGQWRYVGGFCEKTPV